jgi:hypothetical protein
MNLLMFCLRLVGYNNNEINGLREQSLSRRRDMPNPVGKDAIPRYLDSGNPCLNDVLSSGLAASIYGL